MIQRIKVVHEERIIHRDIKPDNFMTGGTDANKNTIFIIDFGLAKCYKSSDGEHIPFIEGKNLTGTARYASINTHIGQEQSRRDDLESLGFVLMYFNKGSLAWQGLPARTKKEKYEKIRDKKLSTSIESLTKGLPEEFAIYLNYCRSLKFEEKPDIGYLRKLFKDLFYRMGYEYDFVFDWMVKK